MQGRRIHHCRECTVRRIDGAIVQHTMHRQADGSRWRILHNLSSEQRDGRENDSRGVSDL
jgi:hypothetical protein